MGFAGKPAGPRSSGDRLQDFKGCTWGLARGKFLAVKCRCWHPRVRSPVKRFSTWPHLVSHRETVRISAGVSRFRCANACILPENMLKLFALCQMSRAPGWSHAPRSSLAVGPYRDIWVTRTQNLRTRTGFGTRVFLILYQRVD